jgi:hypothetical protein
MSAGPRDVTPGVACPSTALAGTNELSIVLPLLSLLSGIAKRLWPGSIDYIDAFYLILIGVVGLPPHVKQAA